MANYEIFRRRDVFKELKRKLFRRYTGKGVLQGTMGLSIHTDIGSGLDRERWVVFLSLDSFAETFHGDQVNSTCFLIEIDPEQGPELSLYGFPDGAVGKYRIFIILLNIDRFPNFEDYSWPGGTIKSREFFFSDMEPCLLAIAHEVNYISQHALLLFIMGRGAYAKAKLDQYSHPPSAQDHNLICSLHTLCNEMRATEAEIPGSEQFFSIGRKFVEWWEGGGSDLEPSSAMGKAILELWRVFVIRIHNRNICVSRARSELRAWLVDRHTKLPRSEDGSINMNHAEIIEKNYAFMFKAVPNKHV